MLYKKLICQSSLLGIGYHNGSGGAGGRVGVEGGREAWGQTKALQAK